MSAAGRGNEEAKHQYFDLEFNLSFAQDLATILAPELADLKGTELEKAIRAKVKAHRTALYWSKRKGGKPAKWARRKP
jgi:hypothetical protein